MHETTNRTKRGLNAFVPTYRTNDLNRIDWSAVAKRGIRFVAIDLDNTLAVHGTDTADAFVNTLVRAMENAGLHVALYSNAAHGRDKRFARSLGIEAIEAVQKPSPDALLQAMATRGLAKDDVLVVGDQLITDIWSANRAGVPSLWVKRRDHKELFSIRLKRILEWLLLRIKRRAFQSVATLPEKKA